MENVTFQTSCSWVFVCECSHVHFYTQSQRFGPFTIKNKCVFLQKTPQTKAKSNIVKNFVVRNDEKVARRINAIPDVTTRPSCRAHAMSWVTNEAWTQKRCFSRDRRMTTSAISEGNRWNGRGRLHESLEATDGTRCDV